MFVAGSEITKPHLRELYPSMCLSSGSTENPKLKPSESHDFHSLLYPTRK
jgi:hypothetical protein